MSDNQDGTALRPGTQVTVIDGTFAGKMGIVSEPDESAKRRGIVRVIISVLGKDVPVEFEPWQVRLVE
jgi:transcription antitermination factor NusG